LPQKVNIVTRCPMLGELTVRDSKDVNVPPGDVTARDRDPGEQRHGRSFVNAMHCHVEARVLVVTEEMIDVGARSSDVVPDVTNGLAPSFSALGRRGVIHVVLSYEFVEDGLVTLTQTGEDLPYEIDRSAHSLPLPETRDDGTPMQSQAGCALHPDRPGRTDPPPPQD
jgi:hypothetical protein